LEMFVFSSSDNMMAYDVMRARIAHKVECFNNGKV